MALTNDFKVKNGLTVIDSISAGGNLSASEGFFDSNVGIGTNNPAHKLHIASGTTNVGIQTISTDAGAYMGFEDNTTGNTGSNSNVLIGANGNNLVAFTNATERLRINSSGNVGIGTTNPSYKLSVSGGDFGVTNGNKVYIGGATGDSVIGYLGNTSGKFTLNSDGNRDVIIGSGTDTDAVFIKGTNGHVGIGTTSPSERLHIHNSTGNSATIRLSDPDSTSTANATGYVEVYHGENTSRAGYFGLITNSEMALATTTSAGNIKLYTGNNTTALTIDSSQRVGIGDTTPSYKLDVAGDINSQSNILSSGVDLADIFATSSGNVDGSGTAGKLSKWSDTDTLTDSLVSESGTTVCVSGSLSAHRITESDSLCNVKIGNLNVLPNITTGSYNTGIGYNVLTNTTIGEKNTAIGYYSMFCNTEGNDNFAVGASSLEKNTTGSNNSAIGSQALKNNIGGNDNVAIGNLALCVNTEGDYNTALGKEALRFNTTGVSNAAIGPFALYCNTEGDYNTALGDRALLTNTTGCYNTAIGRNSLTSNTTGNFNTSIGFTTLQNNTTGSCNVAIGEYALHLGLSGHHNVAVGQHALCSSYGGTLNVAIGKESLRSNTTGSCNTAIGSCSLRANTTGCYNTAIGVNALILNTTGSHNFAVGQSALYSNTTGTRNIGIGACTLFSNSEGNYNTALGCFALCGNTTGDSNIGIGLKTLFSNQTGNYNTALGLCSQMTQNGGSNNFSVGYRSMRDATGGSHNVAFGSNALCLNTTGTHNTGIGPQALASNKTGSHNVAFGYQTLYLASSGSCNFAAGQQTLYNNWGGCYNTAIGDNALYNNTTGNGNVAVGYLALQSNTTGINNAAFQQQALKSNTTGSDNYAAGLRALCNNTEGDYNTAIGQYALCAVTSGDSNIGIGLFALCNANGSQNIAIGQSAGIESSGGSDVTSATNSIAIGCSTKFGDTTPTNEIVIGSAAIGNGDNTTTIGNSSTTDAYICGDINTNVVKSSTIPTGNILCLEDDNLTNQNGVSLQSIGPMGFFIDINNNSGNDNFDWYADGASGGSPTNIMRLTDEGNLGLGTTSPATKLHVAGDSLVTGNSTIYGNLSVTGDFTCLETTVSTTSALSVTNTGTGPALFVCQSGVQPVAHFIDANGGDVVIADDGKVGIGTFSPTQKLDVQGTVLVNNEIQLVDANMRIFRSSNDLRLRTGGGDRVTINSSGNVGIGTTNPASLLHICGGAATLEIDSSTNTANLDFDNSTQTATIRLGNNDLITLVGGSEKMRVLANGNVGIGDTTPSYKLDVAGDINSQSNILSSGVDLADIFITSAQAGDITAVTTGPYLTGGGASGSVEVGIDSACAAAWDAAVAGDISAVVAGTGLTGGGTSGSVTLNISAGDGVQATANCVSVDSTVVRTTGSQTIAGNKTFSDPAVFNNTVGIVNCLYHVGDTTTMVRFDTSQVDFCAGGEEIFRINTQGFVANEGSNNNDFRVEGGTDTHALFVDGSADNVGIGTASPNSKLDVRRAGNGIALELHQTSGATNDYVDLKMIAGNTTAGTYGTILRHKRDGVGGADFSILTNPTLTGTPTEKLTVKSGGNVGIGDTTPSYKLDVAGDIRATGDLRAGDDVFIAGDVLRFTNDAASAYIQSADSLILEADYDADDTGGKPITFKTAGTTKMTIAGGGDVTINNGLTVAGNLSAQNCIIGEQIVKRGGTSSQFLKADGSVDSTSYGIGDITAVTAGTGLIGGGTSGSVTLNLSAGDGVQATANCVSVDSTVVRTTGNQTIAGDKTFSGSALCVSNLIRHTGDPDTCIAFSTNKIDLYAGGEDAINIDASSTTFNQGGIDRDFRVEGDTDVYALFVEGSTDRVGIGTSTPTHKLDVESADDTVASFNSTDNKASIAINDDDTTVYVSAENARGAFGFQAGTHVNNLNIDSSGNVGIGTQSPATKLHVAGDSLVTGNSTIYGNLSVTGDFTCLETTVSTTSALSVTNTGTGPALFVCQAGVQPIAHFIDANGDDIVFADDGKVGIGTFSPAEELTVSGTISASEFVYVGEKKAVSSDDINFIVKVTQAEYDALTPDSGTLYVITDESTNSPVVNPITTVTANYTVTDEDHTILTNGSSVLNVGLPSAATNSNYVYNIKNISTNGITISAAAGNIDGQSSRAICQQFENVTVQSDGSNWFVI